MLAAGSSKRDGGEGSGGRKRGQERGDASPAVVVPAAVPAGPGNVEMLVMGYAGAPATGQGMVWSTEPPRFLPEDEAFLIGVDCATRDVTFVVFRSPAVAQVRACLAHVALGGHVRLEGVQPLVSARAYQLHVTAAVLSRLAVSSGGACVALSCPPASVPPRINLLDGTFTLMPEEGKPSKGLLVYIPAGSRVFLPRDSQPWMVEGICVKAAASAVPAGRLFVRLRVWQPESEGIAQVELLTRIAAVEYTGPRVVLLSSYRFQVFGGNACVTLNPLTLIGVPDQDLVDDVLGLGGFENGGDGGPQHVEATFSASVRKVHADGTIEVSWIVSGVGQVTIPDILPVMSLLWPHAGPSVITRLQDAAGRMPAACMLQSVVVKFTIQSGTVLSVDAM